MNREKLTIIMPSYNNAHYLREAISSVITQKTDFFYKLIIIDDKSTDNSLSIAQEYERERERERERGEGREREKVSIMVVANEKNKGLLATTFDSYEHYLKTDYFTFLDPDDYWGDEYFLQKAVDFLKKHRDYTIYMANPKVLYNDGREHPYIDTPYKEVTYSRLNKNSKEIWWAQTSSVVFRNVVFKHGVPQKITTLLQKTPSPRTMEADSFRNFIHHSKGKIYFINEPSGVYRIHDKGIWAGSSIVKGYFLNAFLYYTFYLYLGKNTPLRFFLSMEYYFNMVLLQKEEIPEEEFALLEKSYESFKHHIEKSKKHGLFHFIFRGLRKMKRMIFK